MMAVDDRDLVLHATAVKRQAPVAAIARLAGVPEARAQAILTEAVASGRAVDARGGYVLTPLAGVALLARYDRHFAGLRRDAAFVAAYETFERINVTLKQIITDWQTVDVGGHKVANDHSDKAHDAAVIDRLGALHDQAETVLGRLSARLPRLSRYAEGLLAALEKAEDGDTEWVSDVRRDSYHTLWFELHEELLRIMGREREE